MPPPLTGDIEELIEQTRAQRLTYEQFLELAVAFDAIGTDRALAHAALTRARAETLTGNYDVDFGALERLTQRFHKLGDDFGFARTHFFRAWVLQTKGNYAEARVYYTQAFEAFQRLNDRQFIASTYTQYGILHTVTGNMPEALIEYNRALPIYKEIGDSLGVAGTMSNIGTIYLGSGDLEQALRFLHEAIPLHEANEDLKYLASTLNNVGAIHYYRKELEHTITYMRRVLDLRIQLKEPVAILTARGTLAEIYLAAGDHAEARAILDTINELDNPDPQFRIDIMIARAQLLLIDGDVESARTRLLEALAMATHYTLPKRELDVHSALRDLAQRQSDLPAYIEHNAKVLEFTEKIAGAGTARQITAIEKEHELKERTQELDQHRSALHSTLPKHIAERLLRGEQINDTFTDAVVLFADIVGFTSHSSTIPTSDVVAFLEQVFSQFDAICERHQVTKIKTIGDSYMCFAADHDASTNARAVAHAACEMIATSFTWPAASTDVTPEFVSFRVGIHCGPVTAGVIGTQRFQYDVWGDTVNVASRMESTSEPGRIHVSDDVARALRSDDGAAPFTVTQRGTLDIKGKGPMETWWVS